MLEFLDFQRGADLSVLTISVRLLLAVLCGAALIS